MNKKITEILNESIRQELLVSDFYGLFETTFREDREFWYILSQEELNHGAILQAERDEFYEVGLLPEEFALTDPMEDNINLKLPIEPHSDLKAFIGAGY